MEDKDVWKAAGTFPMQKLVDTVAKILMARYDGTLIIGTVTEKDKTDEKAVS